MSTGDGRSWAIRSITEHTPMLLYAETAATGKSPRLMTPALSPLRISSGSRLPTSRYFSRSSSSLSAAASMRGVLASSATDTRSEGISSVLKLPSSFPEWTWAFMFTRSMTPLNPSAFPSGRSTGTALSLREVLH